MSHGHRSPSQLGPYKLGRLLRRSLSGPIFEGIDTQTDETVWIQLLDPERLTRADVRTRLLRELGGLRILDDPHVIRPRSLEEQEGQSLIVYEKLGGVPLSALLAEGPMPLAVAVDTVRQAARGLSAMHRRAILHRGLRPETIWIASRHSVKLIDPELCDLGEDLRTSGNPLPSGILAQLAPEQIRGEAADLRTDLYALGVVFVHSLLGHSPFLRAGHDSTVQAVFSASRSEILDRLPLSDASLRELLLGVLSPLRAERPPSVQEFIRRLDLVVRETDSPLDVVPRRRFGDRGPRWPFLVLVLSLAGLGTWGVFHIRQQQADRSTRLVAAGDSMLAASDRVRIWLRTPENRTGRGEFDSLLTSATSRVRSVLAREYTAATPESMPQANRNPSLLTGTLIRQAPQRLRLQMRRIDPRSGRILDQHWVELDLRPTQSELVRAMRSSIHVILRDQLAAEDSTRGGH